MTGSKIVGAGDGAWCPKCGDQPALSEETDDGVVEHRCHNGHEWTVAADGGVDLDENDHYCNICDPPFDTIGDLIEHDCEDDREHHLETESDRQ